MIILNSPKSRRLAPEVNLTLSFSRTIALGLAILLSAGSMFCQPAWSQHSELNGPYPATPASWNGQVTPSQPYVPSSSLPNYIGSGYASANASYGTYRSPSTSLQTPTYTGQALTYRPGVTPYIGGNNSGYNHGFSPYGLVMGGAILGVSALSMGARGLSRGFGSSGYNGYSGNGGNGAGSNGAYTKDMKEADERRAKQEEKIMRELKVAHASNLRRKGITPSTMQNDSFPPSGQPGGSFMNPPGLSAGSGAPRSSEALEGDVLPASAAGKLQF